MRLIDADKLISHCNTNHLNSASLDLIASQPTVEITAPQVRYCSDCGSFDAIGEDEGVCNRNGEQVTSKDYCSWSKKKGLKR